MANFKELMAAAPREMERVTAARWFAEYEAKHPRPERPPEGMEKALEAAAKAEALARGVKQPPYRFCQPDPGNPGRTMVVQRWGTGSPYAQWWRARWLAQVEFEMLYWPAIWAAKAIAEIRKKG